MTSGRNSGNRGSKAAAIVISLALAAAAAGAEQAETLYLPAAAHNAGINGSQWRTDIALFNASEQAVTYTMELLKQDRDNSDPLTVSFALGAGQAVALTDVVASVFGASGSAALRIVADGTLVAAARTYNQTTQGTFGQLIEAEPAPDAFQAGTTATVFPLASAASRDQGFRTNIGLVNTSATEIAIEVSLYRGTGELVGTQSYKLAPYSFTQSSDVFGKLGAGNVEAGYAKARTTTAGGAFFAYASVIDNLSGDPLYIAAE